jgi:hypothetical protein
MKTIEQTSAMDPALKAKLQEALDKQAKGIPFTREEKEEACQHMDRVREENRRLFGESNIAVELIRQTRDNA